MSADSTLEQIPKIISDALRANETPFYTHADFWIFLVLAVVSIIVSTISIMVSRRANSIADEAERIVRRQNVLLEIAEAINMCQTTNAIPFEDMNIKIKEVVKKIRHIIGLYRPQNIPASQELLQKVQESLNKLQEEFYNLTSLTPADEINKTVSPTYTSLVGHLSELQGDISININN